MVSESRFLLGIPHNNILIAYTININLFSVSPIQQSFSNTELYYSAFNSFYALPIINYFNTLSLTYVTIFTECF